MAADHDHEPLVVTRCGLCAAVVNIQPQNQPPDNRFEQIHREWHDRLTRHDRLTLATFTTR